MSNLFLAVYSFLYGSIESIAHLLLVIVYIFIVKRFKISGQKTAIAGFILFCITALLILIGQNTAAGIFSDYAFLLFVISFIQEFYHFLKYEKK